MIIIEKIEVAPMKPHNLFDRNYEKSALDFINHSDYFRQFGEFRAPLDESHGECDAISDSYELDFKLFMSTEEGKERNIIRPHIVTNENDRIKKIHYNKQIKIEYYDLFKCVECLSLEEFDKIHNGTFLYENSRQQRVMESFVNKILLKKKNILFVAPVITSTEKNSLEEITEFFENTLSNMFLYRYNKIKSDSFFSLFVSNDDIFHKKMKFFIKEKRIETNIFSDEYFLIFKYDEGRLKIIDYIDTKVSTFYHRYERNDMFL